MAEFAYTLVPDKLKKFFEHIQTGGVPKRVTTKYLPMIGLKGKNDRTIVPVLKLLGFLDPAGVPTDTWRAYRDKAGGKAVLAAAIRKAYHELFSTYPNAQEKDTEALRNYFSTKTSVGERALAAIVGTFAALCNLADFEAKPGVPEPTTTVGATGVVQPPSELGQVPSTGQGLTLNINIQLALPATDDASIYDRLFAALKKHLLG